MIELWNTFLCAWKRISMVIFIFRRGEQIHYNKGEWEGISVISSHSDSLISTGTSKNMHAQTHRHTRAGTVAHKHTHRNARTHTCSHTHMHTHNFPVVVIECFFPPLRNNIMNIRDFPFLIHVKVWTIPLLMSAHGPLQIIQCCDT
jgi:hypothetical protein